MNRQFANLGSAFIALIILIAAPASGARQQDVDQTPHRSFNQKLDASQERWVRETLSAMTIDEKIGQLFAVEANAIFMSRESAEYRRLRQHIVENKVGSLILFRSDVWATAILSNRLQGLARIPLLVSSDLEMGPGMRLDDTQWWAPNMAVGASGEPELARAQGRATALQARAAGINWIYAPVADVNNNPGNPVINTRSYGEDPPSVAAFVRAFIEGAQEAGAMACAKHFPGHGDTATDSHIGLPVVDVSRERLERVELVPFRAAISSGVGSIMSAHISLPQIEPEPAPPLRELSEGERESAEFLSRGESPEARLTVPGTLSPKVLTGILRTAMRYDGLIVTDAMSMAGVAARWDAASSSVKAIKAGADMIIKSPDLEAGINALRRAVAAGEISASRIDASVERILRAKAALGLAKRRTVELGAVDQVVSAPQFEALAQQIADRSMTLVRDEQSRVPLALKAGTGAPRRLLHVTLTDEEDRNVMLPFLAELRRRAGAIENLSFDHRTRASELSALEARLAGADLVILSVAVRARSGKGSIALPETAAAALSRLLESGRPLVVVSFGSPYLLQAMPRVPAYLAAYSTFAVSQRAAARALAGEIEIAGRLPVTLPGLYPRGHGLARAKRPGN
jgi:beta-N-acetylhexosaminidase